MDLLFGSSASMDVSDNNNDYINDMGVIALNGYAHIIQDVNCIVQFNDSVSANMTWNQTSGLWDYNRSFSSNGLHDWNVTCSKGGYNTSIQTSAVNITPNEAPNVTCYFPENGSVLDYYNVTFKCNVTDDSGLKNITLYSNFTWQKWDYSYDESMKLLFHFNNESEHGEDGTHVYDFSGNENNGTVYEANVTKYGKYSNAFRFDGVDDYITVGDSSSLNFDQGLTVETWIKLRPNPNTNVAAIAGNGEFLLVINITDYSMGKATGRLSAWLNTTGNGSSPNYVYPTWHQTNQTNAYDWSSWHHIAMTYNASSNETKFYMDGDLVLNYNNSEINGSIIPDTKDLTIGSYESYHFLGEIDDLIIYNSTLTESEIYEHVKGIWNSVTVKNISGLSNSSEFIISSLSNGDYKWNALACDDDGLCAWDPPDDGNMTFTINVTYNGGYGNYTPEDYEIYNYLNITPSPAYTSNNLNCNATFDWGGVVIAYWYWYNGSILMLGGLKEDENGINNTLITTLLSSYTKRFDTWNCTVVASDGYLDRAPITTDRYINNTLPYNITLSYPGTDAHIINRTPQFNWTQAVDPDVNESVDNITYNLCLGYTNETCEVINEVGLLNNSYIPIFELDLDIEYFWRVRANDTEGYGNWSGVFNFTIDSYLEVNLTVDTVEFGTMVPGESNDTADGSPQPFKFKNNGNTEANISINATVLWTTAGMDTQYYQFKANYTDGIANSFNWGLSQTTWTDMSNVTQKLVLVLLNHTDGSDSAAVDIGVEAKSDEPPGIKNSTVYFEVEDAY
jgi:hypothetical protein